MYIVSFYSFKGGVGRSMSLVNVAMELAKDGQKVLLVDFDLEAPGLSTFDVLKPPNKYKGIVEFVTDYQKTNESPDVSDYIYKINSKDSLKGEVFVMPAGMADVTYSERLNNINWANLYEVQSGFLLFEDLKEQWRNTISPDYVLVDSRTGFTDVAGICTRQLPNAVCMLFFPNDQNLIGIDKVVSDIRKSPLSSETTMHFVMSNVPDIDDEDGILESRMNAFQSKLKYSKSSIIHHYANLSLLNQSVFTLDRPNSKLAREYCELTNIIRSHNPADRKAAIIFLRKAISTYAELDNHSDRQAYTEQVNKIETVHNNDSEIDFYLARFKQVIGDFDESLALLDRCILNGSKVGSAYVNKASLLVSMGDVNKALVFLEESFEDQSVVFSYLDVVRALRLSLRAEVFANTERLVRSPAVNKLRPEDKAMVAYELLVSLPGAVLAQELIEGVFANNNINESKDKLELYLVFSKIAQGKLKEALDKLRSWQSISEIQDMYNLAFVSYWSGEIDLAKTYFNYVVEKHKTSSVVLSNANYMQCLSFAFWATGDSKEALSLLAESKKIAKRGENRIFSTWRYYKVLPGVFSEDLNQMSQLYEGKKRVPEFLNQV